MPRGAYTQVPTGPGYSEAGIGRIDVTQELPLPPLSYFQLNPRWGYFKMTSAENFETGINPVTIGPWAVGTTFRQIADWAYLTYAVIQSITAGSEVFTVTILDIASGNNVWGPAQYTPPASATSFTIQLLFPVNYNNKIRITSSFGGTVATFHLGYNTGVSTSSSRPGSDIHVSTIPPADSPVNSGPCTTFGRTTRFICKFTTLYVYNDSTTRTYTLSLKEFRDRAVWAMKEPNYKAKPVEYVVASTGAIAGVSGGLH